MPLVAYMHDERRVNPQKEPSAAASVSNEKLVLFISVGDKRYFGIFAEGWVESHEEECTS
jgi:hypothetical protein